METVVDDNHKTNLRVLIDTEAEFGGGRGIFFCSAQTIHADDVNIMATHGRGVVSAVLSSHRAHVLGIPPFVDQRIRETLPLYITSVEAAACTDTGISASERAITLRTLGATMPKANALNTPGHIIPNIARLELSKDGSLSDAAFHFSRQTPSEVVGWCDILSDTGHVANAVECLSLADQLHTSAVLWKRSVGQFREIEPAIAAYGIAAE